MLLCTCSCATIMTRSNCYQKNLVVKWELVVGRSPGDTSYRPLHAISHLHCQSSDGYSLTHVGSWYMPNRRWGACVRRHARVVGQRRTSQHSVLYLLTSLCSIRSPPAHKRKDDLCLWAR